MAIAEKVELGLIPLLGAAAGLAVVLPGRIGLGQLLLCGSALLLFQSLARDLWLLARARRQASVSPPRIARCMCAESMIGMTGIVIGLALFSFGLGRPIVMQRWSWGVFVVAVLGGGFAMKDYVVEAKPWRLRRDKDHINIIVRWRK